MSNPQYQYEKTCTEPRWYGRYPINLKAIPDHSPNIEWYGFASREDAVMLFHSVFSSDKFYEQFEFVGDEIYYQFDTTVDPDTGEIIALEGSEPADLQDVVDSEVLDI